VSFHLQDLVEMVLCRNQDLS